MRATSRNRGRAYRSASENVERLGGTVAPLIDRSWFSSHIICTSFLKGNAHRSGQAVGVLPIYKCARVCYIVAGAYGFVVVPNGVPFKTQEVLFFSSCGRRSSLRWRASFALCAAGGRRCGSAVSAARRHYLYFLPMCTEGQ